MADVRHLFFSVLPLHLLSYSSLLLNLMFQPLCCETSAPHSLFLSFLSVSSFLSMQTHTHTQRQNSLLDDRWQVNNCTASVSQNTDTHTTCTHKHRNKHHLLVLLSLCVQSLVKCLDLFLTAESMH